MKINKYNNNVLEDKIKVYNITFWPLHTIFARSLDPFYSKLLYKIGQNFYDIQHSTCKKNNGLTLCKFLFLTRSFDPFCILS